jgi:hypothetical protein
MSHARSEVYVSLKTSKIARYTRQRDISIGHSIGHSHPNLKHLFTTNLHFTGQHEAELYATQDAILTERSAAI